VVNDLQRALAGMKAWLFIGEDEEKFNKLNNMKILLHPNETNNYTLYWSKNYDIVYNGETLYNIRNDRTWTIYN
jgi:hypothetical protein